VIDSPLSGAGGGGAGGLEYASQDTQAPAASEEDAVDEGEEVEEYVPKSEQLAQCVQGEGPQIIPLTDVVEMALHHAAAHSRGV
jgi:hypothetical protein